MNKMAKLMWPGVYTIFEPIRDKHLEQMKFEVEQETRRLFDRADVEQEVTDYMLGKLRFKVEVYFEEEPKILETEKKGLWAGLEKFYGATYRKLQN